MMMTSARQAKQRQHDGAAAPAAKDGDSARLAVAYIEAGASVELARLLAGCQVAPTAAT